MTTTSIPDAVGDTASEAPGTGDPVRPQTSLRAHVPTDLVERLLASVVATGDQTETTRAPFTGEELITYPISSESDVEEAFTRARIAQRQWAATPVAQRAQIIGRIHHIAFARQDELMDLLQIEAGKARYDAFAEAAAVGVYARYVSRTAPKVLGRHARKGVVPFVTKAYEVRHPRGVVGLVTAWNYPAVFASSDGFSALAVATRSCTAPTSRRRCRRCGSAIWRSRRACRRISGRSSSARAGRSAQR